MIEADCCSISLSSLLRASFETQSNNLLEKTIQLLDCFSHVCVISKDSSATESVFIPYFCTLKAIIIFHGDPHDPLNPKSGGHDPQQPSGLTPLTQVTMKELDALLTICQSFLPFQACFGKELIVQSFLSNTVRKVFSFNIKFKFKRGSTVTG